MVANCDHREVAPKSRSYIFFSIRVGGAIFHMEPLVDAQLRGLLIAETSLVSGSRCES